MNARRCAERATLMACVMLGGCATTRGEDAVAVRQTVEKDVAVSQSAPPCVTAIPRTQIPNRPVEPRVQESDAKRFYSPCQTMPRGGEAIESEASELGQVLAAYRAFRYDVIRDAGLLVSDPSAKPSEKAAGCMLAGAASYLLGDTPQARKYFRSARSLDPNLTPNADTFPEDVLRLFAECGE